MRIIANENVSATVISALRSRGHDVVSAKESMRSAADDAVLRRAADENRLVITHDKDFGALATCFREQDGWRLFHAVWRRLSHGRSATRIPEKAGGAVRQDHVGNVDSCDGRNAQPSGGVPPARP